MRDAENCENYSNSATPQKQNDRIEIASVRDNMCLILLPQDRTTIPPIKALSAQYCLSLGSLQQKPAVLICTSQRGHGENLVSEHFKGYSHPETFLSKLFSRESHHWFCRVAVFKNKHDKAAEL